MIATIAVRYGTATAIALTGLAALGESNVQAAVSVGAQYVGQRSRLVVSVTGDAQASSQTRARHVSVVYGRKTYALRRYSVSRQGSAWRSPLAGGYGGLVGKVVTVAVRNGYREARFRRKVQGSRFRPPSRPVNGDAAFQAIRPYFVNSQFTDCAGRTCAREQSYGHCAGGDRDGSWHHRMSPVGLGPTDGTYHVSDAFQQSDGTWGVTYSVTHPSGPTSTYSWVVQPTGAVLGVYQAGDDVGTLEKFHWRQPAGC